MSRQEKKPSGCGCANIPISVVLIFLGGGYWWFSHNGIPDISNLITKIQQKTVSFAPIPNSIPTPTPTLPSFPTTPENLEQKKEPTSLNTSTPDTENPQPKQEQASPATTHTSTAPFSPPSSSTENPQPKQEQASPNTKKTPQTELPQTPWEKKAIRGIYLSRYQITNNASESEIRDRVRYYKSQGINTIIHGVWGNACTMYKSQVMQQTLGYQSCPNKFQDSWLDWLIDEAHQQGMEVHAYFEKGIKIDKNSPMFDFAIAQRWIIPGVDRTYSGVDHYLLDVEVPEVANFFSDILAEFVQKYPQIDAVQWDDYLGYHAELPGKVDRTESLTKFVQQMIVAMKEANPNVSFDICHHNPYWAKRYFAADWQKWDVDRVFIQAYNEANFQAELDYVKKYNGVAITDKQFHRLPELIDNQSIKSILVFPLSGKPKATASELKSLLQKNE